MSDTSTNPFAAALSGFFFAGDKNDPRVNPQLRQKLALAMMAHGTKYPKNLGEGIAAVGENFADAIMQRRLEQADIAQQGISPPPAAGAAPGQSASLAPAGDIDTAPAVRSAGAPEVAPLPPQVPQKVAPVVVSDGGFNSMDAAADAPQPGDQGTTPGRFANVRYNNPGAAYPGQDATAFGSTGTDTIGGGHKIAQFPTPVHGAAANMSLLERNYTGMPVSAAISKWSGGGRNTVPGFDPNAIVTPELARDPRFMQAIVGGEAPGKYPMSPAQWQMASEWAAQGGPPLGEGGPRDRIAATLAQQQQPPSSQRPSVADYGQPRALAATPPDSLPPEISTGASAISAAPPQPSGIRAAPPQQVAQAQPQAIPGYVPPEAKDPSAAPIIGMKPREAELRNWLVQNQNNPYAAPKVAAELQQLEQERTIRQNEANELYKANIARATEQNKMREQARIDQASRQQTYQKGQQDLISGGGAAPTATDPRLLGTPQSPQRTGIPVTPPVPPGITPKEWSEKQTPELVKAVSAVEKATPQFKQMMDLLQKAETHPGKEWGVGPLSAVTGHLPSAQGFKKIMEQIGGQNFLNAYQTLKGGGSITEIEGSKAEAAQARLSTAQTKEDFNNAMEDFKNSIRENLETVQRKVNQPVTAWQKTPNDEPAPDIGQLGTWKGKVREYIGGNPKLDSSYRDPR